LEDSDDFITFRQTFNYTDLAVFVVLVFEYLVTFDREVHFAWGRKPSWAKTIFLLNRYLSIVEYFVVLGPLLPTISTFVSNFAAIRARCILTQLHRAFSGTRIYAISTRNWSVTSIVVLLALVPAVMNAYTITVTPVTVTPEGCMGVIDLSVTTWTALVYSFLTWIKTWSTIRVAKKLHVQMSFTSLVLNEGILYFCIVLSLNIVQIVFDFVEVGSFSLILPFLNVFTPILISRFFMDLDDLTTHDLNLPSVSSSGADHKGIGSTLHFRDPGSTVRARL
ncbi:hypothetical protein LXA43DRAFT_880959, partial [Ganoderma leucocontextum]